MDVSKLKRPLKIITNMTVFVMIFVLCIFLFITIHDYFDDCFYNDQIAAYVFKGINCFAWMVYFRSILNSLIKSFVEQRDKLNENK